MIQIASTPAATKITLNISGGMVIPGLTTVLNAPHDNPLAKLTAVNGHDCRGCRDCHGISNSDPCQAR